MIETSHNLIDLIKQYQSQIESFSLEYETGQKDSKNYDKSTTAPLATMSNSSSSSSALSCGSGPDIQNAANQISNQDNPMLKNMIVSNLVTYSYEIAYTVKRIVCIMGADNIN